MAYYQPSRSTARQQREELRREKELAKIHAKLTQLDQAKAEVADSEDRIAALMALHKECATWVNWASFSRSLCPVTPKVLANLERSEWRRHRLGNPLDSSPPEPEVFMTNPQHPDLLSHVEHQQQWSRNKALANRVLTGDEHAYFEALNEFSLLDEVAQRGTSINFVFHSSTQVEAVVRSPDSNAIPQEMKTLTASGKVSTKQIPRTQFQEIYQDHICSGLLRVARELFAVLPIHSLLLHAHCLIHDSTTGHDSVEPIYSVIIVRTDLANLNFHRLDPSDAIESFQHRGDFKASRKTGAFQPIEPLSFDDTLSSAGSSRSLADLQMQVKALRESLSSLFSSGNNVTTFASAST